MAFSLKDTLRVLLFAAPGSLTIQDVQKVFTRYHERREEIESEAEEAAVRLEASGASVEEATAAAAEARARLGAAAEVAAGDPAGGGGQMTLPGVRAAAVPSDVPTLVTGTQIREAMQEIEADLRAAGEIYTIREGPGGFRMHTLPEHAEWVRCLRDEPPPVKLSQSNLETLAVVAYRQPTTRSEIESIRGVSCENSVNKLLDRGLIRITGRADLPGRPIQYGTTDAFLDFVGVKSMAELPASDVLSRKQVDEWLTSGTRKVEDNQVGLPGLEEELAAAGEQLLAAEEAASPEEAHPPPAEAPGGGAGQNTLSIEVELPTDSAPTETTHGTQGTQGAH